MAEFPPSMKTTDWNPGNITHMQFDSHLVPIQLFLFSISQSDNQRSVWFGYADRMPTGDYVWQWPLGCGLHQVPGDLVGQCMAQRHMAAEKQYQDHPELLISSHAQIFKLSHAVMGTRRKTQMEKQIYKSERLWLLPGPTRKCTVPSEATTAREPLSIHSWGLPTGSQQSPANMW